MAPSTKREDYTSSSAARRTRSQVAPDWTHTQTLILVNEIAAVESDCLDALSYDQKWKIIADNCAALDVNMTLDQCRRKWESLFSDYNDINRWQAGAEAGAGASYWSIGREKRRSIGLPEEFERELFDAVDDVVKSQVERRASLHPDNVLEDADADPLGVIAPPLLKRQSHQLTPQKRLIEAKPDTKAVDDMETGSVEVMASQLEENAGCVDIMARKLAKKTGTLEVVATQPMEKADSAEVLGTLLKEKAEMIQAILKGKLVQNEQSTITDRKQGRGTCINLARRQGEKLIECFSVIASTLDQLCKVTAHTK